MNRKLCVMVAGALPSYELERRRSVQRGKAFGDDTVDITGRGWLY